MEQTQYEAIREICLSLRRTHPLRQQALAVLEDADAPIPEIDTVLNALLHPSAWGQREAIVARWLVRHADWSQDQRDLLSEKLSAALSGVLDFRKFGRVAMRWLLRGAFVCSPFVMEVLIGGFHHSRDRVEFSAIVSLYLFSFLISLVVTVLTAVFSLPLSVFVDNARLRQFRPLIKALGFVGQSAAVAPLAQALMDVSLQSEAATALARITRRTGADAYEPLGQQCFSTLCRALTPGAPSHVLMVILRLLELIGDGRAAYAVSNLLKRRKHDAVRNAAMRLLPILQQRASEQRAVSTLLRASQAPTDTGQTLLRPSLELSTVDPSQLLRMATSLEEEKANNRNVLPARQGGAHEE